ncbi:DUF3618 domain-containing protein [Actinomycetaceae bacterium TAE3-ERU4]|nr:DUF3618 domain-containing protein [Actinomycetaceae bacterium TAE3-ERU4]
MSIDYDFTGSASQIEKQLEEIRGELTENVNALTDRLHPKNLASDAKNAAKQKVESTKAAVTQTFEAASNGDRVAQRNLAIAAAGTLTVVGLVVWRIVR